MRFDEIDGEDIEDPGLLSALGRKFRQGINPLWDEMAGVGTAWKEGAGRLARGDLPTPSDTLTSYRRGRDESRAADDAAALYHPTASTAAELAGGLIQGAAVPGSTLGRVVAGGAATGAAQGLGSSRADLTTGDMDEYLRAVLDAGTGAGVGGAVGAAAHGVGKGVRWVGQKGSEALARARGTLVAEEGEALAREAAEREAPEVARQAKEAERLGRDQGQAMEMNKTRDKRAARESDRAASARTQVVPGMRAPREVAPARGGGGTADPNDTAVLRGYQGSAGERRALNYDRVQGYRQQLSDPALPEAQRARLQRYVDSYGDAVDNPGGFERARIEQELRKRFPAADVDRIMRERVGPDGSIRSRAELEDVTQPGDMGDVARQGRAEDVRRLGGGGSAWADAGEPTRRALIRTSPREGVDIGNGEANHMFEFSGGDGRNYKAEVISDASNPEVIHLEVVYPEGGDFLADLGHAQSANALGPGVMKNMLRELAREFPEARRITGNRVTGANVGHDVGGGRGLRLPEVTRPGLPPHLDGLRDIGKPHRVPIAELDDIPAKAYDRGRAQRVWDGEEGSEVRVMQDADGRRELAGGNHRLAVARARGDTELPVRFLDEEAAQVRAGRRRGTSPFDNAEAPIDSHPDTTRPGTWEDELVREEAFDAAAPTQRYELLPEDGAGPPRGAGIRRVPLGELDDIPAHVRDQGRYDGIKGDLSTLPPIRIGSGVDGVRGMSDGNHRLSRLRDIGAKDVLVQFEDDAAAQVLGNRPRGDHIDPTARAPMDARLPDDAGPTQRMDLSDVERQGRAEQLRRMGGGGSGFEDMAAPLDMVDEVTGVSVAKRSPLAPRPTSRLAPGVEQAEGFFRERPMPGAPAQPSPPPPAGQPTRAGRPVAQPAAPPPGPGTRVERARPAPVAVPAPAAPAQRPILAEEDLAGLQQYLDEVAAAPGDAQARAAAREAGAVGQVARAGYEGVRGASNTLGAMLGGGVAITREGLRSPAVRARALSALQVDALARLDPTTFARVGRSLETALAAGQEEYAAAVHVLNQTDPEFQAASRRAEEAVKDVDDERLEALLKASGYLR